MLIRFVIPGLIKLFLLLYLPGLFLGLAAYFVPGAKRGRIVKIMIVVFAFCVEAAVLIDQQKPFLIGAIYNMAAMSPNPAIHFIIGLAGDAVWFWWLYRKTTRFSEWIGKKRRTASAE